MVECCNTPDVTFHICNSNSCHFRICDMIFPPWLGFVFCFSFYSCHASHIMSSCASHLHMCSSHASEHFPRCPFCDPTLICPPASLFASLRVRVLNVLGLDRDLPSGLGILPVDRLSSFVPFGLRLILQRLTEEPKRPRVCCSPTPLQSSPKPTKTPSIISVVQS